MKVTCKLVAISTSDNGKRLLGFAEAHDMIIINTVVQHQHIHTASWYPPNLLAKPSLKDCSRQAVYA